MFAKTSQQRVEPVKDWRYPEPPEQVAEPPGLPERGKEHHAAAMIAGDESPIVKYQPPTIAAF